MRAMLEDLAGPLPPLGRVLEFMRVLWALDHGLQSTSKRMLAELEVTGPQRLALRMIGRFPGISAGRLARVLHMHPSTLTGILQRLEERRLLERRRDPRDARRWLFGLTREGRALDVERPGTVEAAVTRALESMDPERLESARAALEAIVAELGGSSR